MTSAELSDAISGNLRVIDTAINVSPPQIYKAATQAQIDVLMDTRAIERIGTIVFKSGTMEYKFTAVAVEGATNASPIVIKATDHPFSTGDTVSLFGVLGNTGANRRYTVTKIDDDNFSLDGSIGNGAYTSGGYIYHDLMSAFEIKMISNAQSPYGPIEIVDPISLENDREDFMNSQSSSLETSYLPKIAQVFEEDGIRLLTVGQPTQNIVAKLFFTRIPVDGEAITETKNPIIPSIIRTAFIQRTMWHLLMFSVNNETAKKRAMEYEKDYYISIKSVKIRNASRRFRRDTRPEGLRW
jgi:hypothetical protein